MNLSQRFFSNFFPINIEKRIGTDLPTLEINYFKGKYLLDGEKVNYSFGSLYNIFLASFNHYKINEKPIKNVLILGFGAGSVAHILQKKFKLDCNITGVEIDPVVLELGVKYFNTDSYFNTEIFCEDAFSFLQNDTKTYDLIVIDIFIEKHVPIQFLKPEFMFLVKNRVKNDGYVFYNKMSENQFHQNETLQLKDSMIKIFKHEIDTLNVKTHSSVNSVLVYHDEKVRNPEFVLKSCNMNLSV